MVGRRHKGDSRKEAAWKETAIPEGIIEDRRSDAEVAEPLSRCMQVLAMHEDDECVI